MSIDRDALLALLGDDSAGVREYLDGSGDEAMADRILALDKSDPRVMVVHSEEEFRARVQAELRAEAAEARLANIAALRDEMRTAGGAVVWIDDLDTILDGASPGAALTAEEAADVAQVLRSVGLPLHMQALAARLEAQQ